jgi:hypothetical protein
MDWQCHLLGYHGQLLLHYWQTPSLIRVCWVSFGAWLLGQSNYDCIWLAKFPPLLYFVRMVRRVTSDGYRNSLFFAAWLLTRHLPSLL